MIIDDSVDTRELFTSTLEAEGFQVLGAEHPDRPLKLGTAQGKIERDHEQKPGFPQ